MLIKMEAGADERVKAIIARIKKEGFNVLLKNGQGIVTIAVIGSGASYLEPEIFEKMPGVIRVIKTATPLGNDYSSFLEEMYFFQ